MASVGKERLVVAVIVVLLRIIQGRNPLQG
jgi:hypothetical protein